MMRLSAAIRLGAMLKPQHFGDFYDDSSRSASCALGAAIDAGGLAFTADPDDLVWPADWDGLFKTLGRQRCPQCGISACDMIPHLNDDHRWSRERIADLVELHEAPPVPETAHDLWLSRSEHTELLERSTLPTSVREC